MTAEVGDEHFEIEIMRSGDSVTAKINGNEHELEVSEPERGIYLFKRNGKIYEARVGKPKRPGDPVEVKIGGQEMSVKIFDPRKLRGSGSNHDNADGLAAVKTAMPGKVVRLLAAAGDAVEKGQGVVVVEAMKMQNELKSPKDGVVKEIRVAEGQTVAAGDILAVIE